MRIVNGIAFFWPNSTATIPTGWSNVSSYSDVFPKGAAAGVDPGTTGGTGTHTHTSTATHTHTLTNHTHTITIPSATGASTTSGAGSTLSLGWHDHGTVGSGAIASGSASTVSSTYLAYSNNPPYYTVALITPTTYKSFIPANTISLADAAAPTGFYACDGTNGTVNLVDKFLALTISSPGVTGGYLTNTHDLSHSHTTTHVHSAVTSAGGSISTPPDGSGGSALYPLLGHTHSVDLAAATPGIPDDVTLPTSAETVEPAYTKLLAIQCTTNMVAPRGIIATWTGTLANIPKGWILCDGSGGTVDMRSRHLKCTATVGSVAATGGSNTHTHASQNHTPAAQSHVHYKTLSHTGSTFHTGGGRSTTDTGTIHSAYTDYQAVSFGAGSTSANSSSNEPSYKTVAYIKLTGWSGGGNSFFANFVNWRTY